MYHKITPWIARLVRSNPRTDVYQNLHKEYHLSPVNFLIFIIKTVPKSTCTCYLLTVVILTIWNWKSSTNSNPSPELLFSNAVPCYLITRATVEEFWTAKSIIEHRNELIKAQPIPKNIKEHLSIWYLLPDDTYTISIQKRKSRLFFSSDENWDNSSKMEKSQEFFDGFLNVKSRAILRNIRSGAMFGAVEK